MKQIFIIRALMLYLLVATGAGKAQAQGAREYFNDGLELYKQKEYEKALKKLDKAIEINPDYQVAYQARGNVFFALREYDNAIDDYSDAIDIAPTNAMNYYNRGNAYHAVKMYDSAITDFSQAISLKPDYAFAFWNRGLSYSKLRQRDLAYKDYSRAISVDSTLAGPYNGRGLNSLFRGEYEQAIKDFKKAVAIDVNREKPYIIINIIEPLARLYRFSEAGEYYKTFRANYTAGYIDDKGWLFFKKYIEAITQNLTVNDYAGAIASLTQAEKLYSTKTKTADDDESQRRGYSSVLALKGYVLEKMNNNDAAMQAYEQTLVINPQQPDVIAALQRLNKKDEALVHEDKSAPVINILEPLQNQRSIAVEDDKVAGARQRIRGQVKDPSGIRSLQLNNQPLKFDETGYFETEVDIKDGVNIFTLVATDKNANSSSENVQVLTSKEKTNAAPPVAPEKKVLNDNPVYHAVLIAENEYIDKNIPSLQAPVADMYKIYNLLVNNYIFAPENTDTLVNATRANILEAIIKKANAMNENDNLFIFYAGHGQMIIQPDKTEEGFLVPQDAVKGMLSSYISSDDLLRTIKFSKAKHILFVADACFAGTLFRDISAEAPMMVADAYKDKSRKLLASGNRTAVPDKSEFIEYLRLALQENRERYITAEQLIDSFKNQYKSSTHLQLQYFPIKNVEDLGGQFVFKRK